MPASIVAPAPPIPTPRALRFRRRRDIRRDRDAQAKARQSCSRRGLVAMKNPVTARSPAAPERYDAAAVAFHWTVAALIVVLGALGLLFDDMPREARPFWINLHACVGLIYFGLVVARLAWRVTRRAPALPSDMGELTRRAASLAHGLLYGLMLALPVLGFVAFVWRGRAFDYGLFQMNFGVAVDRAVFKAAEQLHALLAYALFALAGLHGAAALYHQFVRRDGLLLRMAPGRAR
jgi:cytochrome b561